VAVVGVVVAAAAVLCPTAAGKLGKQGTCWCCCVVFPPSNQRGRPSKIRSCARSTRSSWFFAAALRSLPSTSWSCVWFAAKALVAIKAALHDPGNVLWDWDLKFGNDPCHWSMVTCQKGQIQELYVLLILCIYGRLFLFCHDFDVRLMVLFVCTLFVGL